MIYVTNIDLCLNQLWVSSNEDDQIKSSQISNE